MSKKHSHIDLAKGKDKTSITAFNDKGKFICSFIDEEKFICSFIDEENFNISPGAFVEASERIRKNTVRGKPSFIRIGDIGYYPK